MARYKQRYAPVRWRGALAMLLVSLLLVAGSVAGYHALRRPYLTTVDTVVSMDGARQLAASSELLAQHGVLSAAETLSGGHTSGYVVITATTGYKSVIRLQSTFTVDGTRLAAVRVLSQDETEYLGDRIVTPVFTERFAGRLLPTKLDGSAALGSPVDGLSGSTVSAAAVVKGVNEAYAFLQEYLGE